MASKQPLMIGGQKVGKLKASWMLFKESWKYLRADKEMVLIPFITGLLNLLVFGVLVFLFVTFVLGTGYEVSGENEPLRPIEWFFVFLVYVVGAFTVALSQAAITNTVYTRAHGGNAALGDSLWMAFRHSAQLFVWSIITSTVGIVLRMIAERSKLIGRIVIAFIGVAWSVLTYFVVPAMVLEKHSAFASIGRSGKVFRQTWGESIVSNVSLGLVFFFWYVLLVLAFIGLLIVAAATELPALVPVVFGLFILLFFVTILIQSALEVVLKTLLFMYAVEGVSPAHFDNELLANVLVRQDQTGGNTDAVPVSPNTFGGNSMS